MKQNGMNLLQVFNDFQERSWPELSVMYNSSVVSIIDKLTLAQMLKRFERNEWIEKIPGIPLKWKITDSGRNKFKDFQRNQKDFI